MYAVPPVRTIFLPERVNGAESSAVWQVFEKTSVSKTVVVGS